MRALDLVAALTGLLLAARILLLLALAVRIGLGNRCCFARCGRTRGAGPSRFGSFAS